MAILRYRSIPKAVDRAVTASRSQPDQNTVEAATGTSQRRDRQKAAIRRLHGMRWTMSCCFASVRIASMSNALPVSSVAAKGWGETNALVTV